MIANATDKKAQFMVRIDQDKADIFKAAVKLRGQSVQFILEKAIDRYIEETEKLKESGSI